MPLASTLQRVTFLTAAVGLSQLSKNNQVKKSRIIYSATLLCITFIIYPVQIKFMESTDSLVERISNGYFALMTPFGIILSIGNSIFHRKAFAKAVNTLLATSIKLEKLTGHELKIPIRKYSMTMIISCLIVGCLELDPWESIVNTIIEYIGMIYSLLLIFHTTTYTLIIRSMLISLNRGLQEIQNFETEILNKLYGYRIIFHEIFTITRKFNKAFSTIFTWLIFHSGVILITGGYFTVQALKQQPLSIYFTVDSIRWCIFSLMALCFYIYPFSQTSQQNEKILKTINNILVRTQNHQLIPELQLFSTLILQEKIIFAPHNLFLLGNNIILTVVSASVTYLVILTQLPQ